jgi:hypothetical protein
MFNPEQYVFVTAQGRHDEGEPMNELAEGVNARIHGRLDQVLCLGAQ